MPTTSGTSWWTWTASSFLALALGTALAGDGPQVPELSDETFDALREEILPDEDECAWLAIPWRGRVQDAVEEARERGRPVLVWAMNGHPLACT